MRLFSASASPAFVLLVARASSHLAVPSLLPSGANAIMGRVASPRCCTQPPLSSTSSEVAADDLPTAGKVAQGAPLSPSELREQVKSGLRQMDRVSSLELMRAQAQAITAGVSDLMEMIEEAQSQGASITKMLSSGEQVLDRRRLDEVLSMQLPVLMRPEFPQFMQRALQKVKSPVQQLALLELNRYVLGAYEEMADGVVDLHWQQLNKLRELCDAAADGGPDGVQATAEAMRAELDSDFCNFLNEAIEQEEGRLRGRGIKPVPEPGPYVTPLDDEKEKNASWKAGHDEEEGSGPAQWPGTSAALEEAARAVASRKGQEEDQDGVVVGSSIDEQQWLLVLRTIKRGVYALLAKTKDDDIKQVRYICNLASFSARRELTRRVLDELTPSERAGFIDTVRRIADNLSVPRGERDEELRDRVQEICDVIDRTA